jgi:hypothetical protein
MSAKISRVGVVDCRTTPLNAYPACLPIEWRLTLVADMGRMGAAVRMKGKSSPAHRVSGHEDRAQWAGPEKQRACHQS